MKRFNRWRLLAGLIMFFAGLDVALLLSHMSRLVGVIFLLLGSGLILTSNEGWTDKVKGYLPGGLLSVTAKDDLVKVNICVFIGVIVASTVLFFDEPYVLSFILALSVFSQLLLWRYRSDLDTKHIYLIIEFQSFVFLSTTVYVYFGHIFGYRDVPDLFPLLFITAAWILEFAYLRSKLLPSKVSFDSTYTVSEGTPLSETLIYWLTYKGKLKPYMPLAGIAIFAMVVAFNFIVHGYLRLGSHDGIAMLLGVCLLVYNKIPEKYSFERDFAFLFLFFLSLILVLPITIIHYAHGPLSEDTNSPVVYHLLARPTSWLLNLIGMDSVAYVTSTRVIVGLFVPDPVHGQRYTEVSIGLSCTGLYSVTTFISAFLAFLMVHFKKFTFKLGAFMALGIFASWVANIFRMTLILVVRYHYGRDAMLWTHHNAGIFIFMAWVALFWGLMFKYLDIPMGKGD